MADEADTKAKAQALLDEYYKEQGLKGTPNLLSWNQHDDGTMVVVDGASGRKLTFAPQKPKPIAPTAQPKASKKAN